MSFMSQFKEKQMSSQQKQQQVANSQVTLPPQQSITFDKKQDDSKQRKKGKPGGGWDSDDENGVKPEKLNVQNTIQGKGGKPDFLQPKKIQQSQPKENNQDIIYVDYSNTNNNTPNGSENSSNNNQSNTQNNQTNQNNQNGQNNGSTKPAVNVGAQKQGGFNEPQLSRVLKLGEFDLLEGDDLEHKNIEYENKIVNDIIQPGGARLKQTDQLMNNFIKASENFQVPIIGSLLISKIFMELPLIMKIRAVFAKQELVRKNKKYQSYFKFHIQLIKQCPIPQDDTSGNLQKEINYLGQLVDNPNAVQQIVKIENKFVNKQPKPVEQKQSEFNLIDLDDIPKTSNQENSQNLLDGFLDLNINSNPPQQNGNHNQQAQQPNDQQKTHGKLNSYNFMKNKINSQQQQQQPQYAQQPYQQPQQQSQQNQQQPYYPQQQPQQQNQNNQQEDLNQRYKAFDLF